ncbi:MAG: MerR family transcriptional regulator [Dehalococcoidia bacterium]|nr:MerR family transcriptional regulator [Dehalococcoidia bacterium]
MLSEKWLALGEASKTLGVNQATLRLWSDRGQVRSFRTPGGHRRFSAEDVLAIIRQEERPGGASAFRDIHEQAVEGVRRRIRPYKTRPYLSQLELDDEDRKQMRLMGRRMVELVVEYLKSQRNRPRALLEAKSIGESYGAQAARKGLSLIAFIDIYLFFRHSLEDVVEHLSKGLFHGETGLVWPKVNGLLDQVFLAAVAAYENTSHALAEKATATKNSA